MKFYVIFSILAVVTLQGGCMMQEKKDPYKQGELVTWKFNEELIIQTHLGQRRKHIKDEDKRIENTFYRPHLEHYVGQFPIDYQPIKHKILSTDEAKAIEPYKRDVTNWLEFDLMLNGSWVEPTDESIHSPRALDHEDQVKVRISYMGVNSKQNTKEFFENDLMKDLDKNSEHELYGMKCFNFLDSQGKRCLGQSSNINISGFDVLLLPNHRLPVRYQEFIYGGVSIEYILNEKNLNKIQQIDQAIWRMLDAWNVSPNQPN